MSASSRGSPTHSGSYMTRGQDKTEFGDFLFFFLKFLSFAANHQVTETHILTWEVTAKNITFTQISHFISCIYLFLFYSELITDKELSWTKC